VIIHQTFMWFCNSEKRLYWPLKVANMSLLIQWKTCCLMRLLFDIIWSTKDCCKKSLTNSISFIIMIILDSLSLIKTRYLQTWSSWFFFTLAWKLKCVYFLLRRERSHVMRNIQHRLRKLWKNIMKKSGICLD